MTTITEGEWEDFLERVDGEERRDYSGRGMYGKKCPAIITDESLFIVGCNAREAFGEYAFELNPCQDNMGLSAVVYFPDLEIVEDY